MSGTNWGLHRASLRLLLAGCLAYGVLLTSQPGRADSFATVEDYIAQAGLPPDVDAPRLLAALQDAGQNWRDLALALDHAAERYAGSADEAEAVSNLAWLIVNAPHLDRLELSSEMLASNLELALEAARDHGYDPSSDFFRRYVLNYRIDDEPVTDWRKEFAAGASPEQAAGLVGSAAILRAAAAAAMAGFLFHERGYFGPQADPLSIRNARAGTKSEAALLLAASLRGAGWPTRFVSENASGTSWVEVYAGDGRDYDPALWLPVYPQAPELSGDETAAMQLCGGQIAVVTAGDAFGREQVTARYGPTGSVELSFTRGGQPAADFTGFAITTWRDGRFVPLDDLEYPVSAMDYPLDSEVEGASAGQTFHLAAPGEYRLEAGVRYPGGVVDVKLLPFTVAPGASAELSLALDAAPGLPLAAFVDRQLGPLPADPAFPAQGRYLFAVYDESEPSIRTRELLERFKSMGSVRYVILDTTTAHERADEFLAWLQVKPEDARPVVALIVDGETRLYHRGYELSIADWVLRALEEVE